jgi:hypothetical protein
MCASRRAPAWLNAMFVLDADVRRSECGVDFAAGHQRLDGPPANLDNAIAAGQAGFECRAVRKHLQHAHLGSVQAGRKTEADELAVRVERVVGGT